MTDFTDLTAAPPGRSDRIGRPCCFAQVANILSAGQASTVALSESTEAAQFARA